MTDYETILVDRPKDGFVRIRFNRPDKKNAMNPTMHFEMHEVLTRLRDEGETRVLLLTGEGDAFCAGQDLKQYFYDFQDRPGEKERVRRISNEWRSSILRDFPAVTVAMINGFCFGGAFTIVGACDIAIARKDALFGLSEINFGHIPAGLVSKYIVDVMDIRKAMYYSLTGKPFDGEEAERSGLVTWSVAADELESFTTETVDSLLEKDGIALRACKAGFKNVDLSTMSHGAAFSWLQAKAEELRLQHELHGGEGVKEFVESDVKRRPGMEVIRGK